MSDNFGNFDIDSTFGDDSETANDTPDTSTDQGAASAPEPETPAPSVKKSPRKKTARKKASRASGTFTRDEVRRIIAIREQASNEGNTRPVALLSNLLDVADNSDDIELPIAVVANGKSVTRTLTKIANDVQELEGLGQDDLLTFGFLVIERVSRATNDDNAQYQRALESVLRAVAPDTEYEHDGIIIRSDTSAAKIARARTDGLFILSQRNEALNSVVSDTERLVNGS